MSKNRIIKRVFVFIKRLLAPWQKLLGFILFVLYAGLSFVREILPLNDSARLQIGTILDMVDWRVLLIIGLVFAWVFTAWRASGRDMEDEPIWANLFIKPTDDIPMGTIGIRIDRFGSKSVTHPVIELKSLALIDEKDRTKKHPVPVEFTNRLFKDITFTEANSIGNGKPIVADIATVKDGRLILLLEKDKELFHPYQMTNYDIELWVGGRIGENGIVTQSFTGILFFNGSHVALHEKGELIRHKKWIFPNRPAKIVQPRT